MATSPIHLTIVRHHSHTGDKCTAGLDVMLNTPLPWSRCDLVWAAIQEMRGWPPSWGLTSICDHGNTERSLYNRERDGEIDEDTRTTVWHTLRSPNEIMVSGDAPNMVQETPSLSADTENVFLRAEVAALKVSREQTKKELDLALAQVQRLQHVVAAFKDQREKRGALESESKELETARTALGQAEARCTRGEERMVLASSGLDAANATLAIALKTLDGPRCPFLYITDEPKIESSRSPAYIPWSR